jgi:hypothetical protein
MQNVRTLQKKSCDETSICDLSGFLAGDAFVRPMMGGQECTIYDTMLVFQENQGPGR